MYLQEKVIKVITILENYSSVVLAISMERQLGHYILDYYIPTILLVCMSWVSFWLHPNAVPGRTTLGIVH